jgi:phage N-6-adenine-methyltransferase
MNLNDCWQTPEYVLKGIRIGIAILGLDPCANDSNNCKALRCFTEKENGLIQKWTGEVFVNNPYSRNAEWIQKIAYQIGIAKAREERLKIIQLCPSAILSNQGTKNLIADCLMVPLGRVKFVPPQELINERLSKGLRADPGIPRSDVSLFFYGFHINDVIPVSSYFGSQIWRLGK